MSDTNQQTRLADYPGAAFSHVVRLMNYVGTFWIFVLTVIILIDIIGRGVFNSPLQGSNELVSMSIVGIVFMQLPQTLRSNRFIRSEIWIDKLIAAKPAIGYAADGIYRLAGAWMMGVICWFAIPHLVEAWEIDLYVGTFGVFVFPLWPIRLILVIGLAATMLQFLLQAAELFVRAASQSSQLPPSQDDGGPAA